MALKDFPWRKLVSSVAPTIGTALGGPMAGAAVAALSNVVLGKEGGTPADIGKALAGCGPEQLMKLKEADREFATKMKELEIDVFALEVKDRDSARELFKVNALPQIILAAIFTTGYLGVLVAFLSGQVVIDDSLRDPFNIVLGVLTAGMLKVLDFFFGSSFGSKEKTAGMLSQAVTAAQVAVYGRRRKQEDGGVMEELF